jgi:hypothetical protein
MINVHRVYFCFFLAAILIPPAPLAAFDFGLITNQYAGFYNQTDGENIENIFEYKGGVIPRFSGLVGDSGEFLISAGFSFRVKDGFYFVPELLRTEINFRFGGSAIRAGRIYYSDPLGFIAGGLFDGAQFSHNTSAGIFSAGVWYTGLLYTETAKITMTDTDMDMYEAELDYGDFADTYFAPRRLLASLDWEHPSIAGLFSLRAALTGQFDLTGADEKLHTQYLTVKASIPLKSLLFEIGGSLETLQTVLSDDSKFTMAFAGDFGVFWTPPLNFHSRLSLSGHIAGGGADGFTGAFVPLTTKGYGGVFQPKLSALSILALDYTARLGETIGAGLSASCFVRNDLSTYTSYPAGEDSKGYFLGTEFFAGIVWSPVSDLQLNIGGGAFLPALGDAGPQEQALWRAEITMTLAIH